MIRLTSTLLFAAALLASSASAQQPPEIQSQSKKTATSQAPPDPVMVPLSVGTAFNATLTTPLDALHAKDFVCGRALDAAPGVGYAVLA